MNGQWKIVIVKLVGPRHFKIDLGPQTFPLILIASLNCTNSLKFDFFPLLYISFRFIYSIHRCALESISLMECQTFFYSRQNILQKSMNRNLHSNICTSRTDISWKGIWRQYWKYKPNKVKPLHIDYGLMLGVQIFSIKPTTKFIYVCGFNFLLSLFLNSIDADYKPTNITHIKKPMYIF